MKRRLLIAGLLSASLSLCLLAASSASAAVQTLNFTEAPNEAGTVLTGINVIGASIGPIAGANPEEFHISSPNFPPNYAFDALLGNIGISRTDPSGLGDLFVMREAVGGPVSDYIWVHQFIPGFTVIDFVSDSEGVPLILPNAPILGDVVENGGLQFVGNYVTDPGGNGAGPTLVNLFVQSDVESVPESASLIVWSLLGLSVGVAGWSRRRRIA
jgi:hypothetical protein